jgi:ribosomal protein S18 acetylase RimI-like enzyme
MTQFPRLRMRLTLVERALSGPWGLRAVEPSDGAALGALMLPAYRGTVDDEGETEADAVGEVERAMEGEYGPFLWDCSFVAEHEDRPVGASMVTLFESSPFLAYVVVHPDVKRRGIGSHLIAASGNALLAAGYEELDLIVTEANGPAGNLYRKLGFRVVDRLEQPASSS